MQVGKKIRGIWVQLDFGGPPKFKSGLNPVLNFACGLNEELNTSVCRFCGAFKRDKFIAGLNSEYMMPLPWLWHKIGCITTP